MQIYQSATIDRGSLSRVLPSGGGGEQEVELVGAPLLIQYVIGTQAGLRQR